ncbi:TetR family transcriptional regulator [bacterium]|nr:TetR family transcriptional regulator [bacterium]
MQAAISVFASQGFFNSTVADVAKVASVADGTIYLYFKNKDDLLISIFEQSMDMFIDEVSDKVKEGGTPQEKLKRYITLHLELVQKNQDLAQVIQIELRQSSKFMKEYANAKFFEYMNILQVIIEEGQAKNVFRQDADPVILKRAIFGAIDEMALEWVLMKRKRYSIEDAAHQVYQLFTEGLTI